MCGPAMLRAGPNAGAIEVKGCEKPNGSSGADIDPTPGSRESIIDYLAVPSPPPPRRREETEQQTRLRQGSDGKE